MKNGPLWLLLVVVFLGSSAYGLYQAGYITVPESGSEVAFEKLHEGDDATIGTRVNYRIKTEAELTKLWKILGLTSAMPSIDFSTKEVAAVFAGLSRRDIGVIRVTDTSEKRVFSIELLKPEENCDVRTVSPYELIVVPKTTLSLTHKDYEVPTGCP